MSIYRLADLDKVRRLENLGFNEVLRTLSICFVDWDRLEQMYLQ